MFFLLVSFVPYPISEFFCFFARLVFFRSSYFSGGVLLSCSCTRYASTLLAYLGSLAAFGFSLSHSLWLQNLCLYDEESGRTLGVLLMSLGRKNGLMWRQQHQQLCSIYLEIYRNTRGVKTVATAARNSVLLSYSMSRDQQCNSELWRTQPGSGFGPAWGT